MSGHGHSHSEKKSRRAWWISAVVAVLAYAAGVYGFSREHHGLDPFYFGFQLFLIEPPHDGEMNAWIEVGRWGALALDMFAVVVIGRRMFAQEIARARLSRARGHFVVSAAVDQGRAIASAIRQRHPKSLVTIVDPADSTGGVVGKIASRTYFVPGTVGSTAHAVHLHEAAEVIVAGPDDAANLAAAAQVTSAANAHRTQKEQLVCQVQIQSVGVRETLRRANRAEGALACVRSFDHYERAVTRLFARDLPLDGGGILATDPTEVHVVIVGHGDWALAAANAAVRIGHFANRKPLRLSVVADDPRLAKCLAERFEPVAQLVRYEARTAGPESREGAAWLQAATRAADTRMTVVIAPIDDARAIELESAVRGAVKGTDAGIAVRLEHGEGLASLLREGGVADRVKVVPFGWLDNSAWAGLLEDDEREAMARIAHLEFLDLARAHGRNESVDQAVKQWRDAREDFKESNRQQVDHLWLKVRAAQSDVVASSDPRPAVEWPKEQIDVLAEMEHNRWMAERLLGGWRLGPEDKQARISPHLVPWADLAEDIRDYDRNAVKKIPNLIRCAGDRKVCRR